MAEVDVFLKEEWPALGDSEALEKQLEQCTVSITRLIGNYSILLNEPSLYRSYTYFCIRLLFLKIHVIIGLSSAMYLNLWHFWVWGKILFKIRKL